MTQTAIDIAPASRETPRSRRRRRWLWWVLSLLLVVAAGTGTHRQAERAFLGEAAGAADTTLRLAIATLRGQLERFERLPPLIADQLLIRALAANPEDPVLVSQANAYLEALAVQLGATDVYLMDRSGLTRAASNHAGETSFIGGNFAFRPYFTEAIAKGEGRFFALGTTSLKRGYYFGAPVPGEGGSPDGVLVFKIDLDAIEDTWRGGAGEIVVTDPEGIVFLSSRDDWLFQAMEAPTPERRARTDETRRYADTAVGTLPVIHSSTAGFPTVAFLSGEPESRTYLRRSEEMPEAPWTVHVLADRTPAGRQALTLALAVAFATAFATLAAAAVSERRARLAERMQMQQSARVELERRVHERTAELAALNTRLAGEVAERTAAEAELRRTQAGLVQAGKMAALGQMSAALSHEFNQPLGAIRNYAENALVFFDRSRADDARGNVERILGLTERLGAISRNLHSFARNPGQRLVAVNVGEVVAAAAEIAGLRLKAAGASLDCDLAPDLPEVVGGPVRLQQVLVNLITNAADAIEAQDDRRIILNAGRKGEDVTITVRDFGPGVPPGLIERIFDPFFSTKGVGKGLGLGLSISYNIINDFGGSLSVRVAEGGGAEFVIRLRVAGAGMPVA